MATSKKKASKKKAKRAPRRKKAGAASVGLSPKEVSEEAPEEIEALAEAVENDGGAVLARYRDPFGGNWQLVVALPLEMVKPIEFQRDLSDTHVKKLVSVIDRMKRYLDPIIVVRTGDGAYATPNGHHRWEAMKRLGAKTILGVLIPEVDLAYQILALNTEKAPNLKDRSLEVIRMARALVELGDPPESQFENEFEEPSYLTIGAAYEKRPRFAGSTYHSIVKKVEGYFDDKMSECIAEREGRADSLLELDDAVNEVVARMKKAGFVSPYLKSFVVSRINPVRGPQASGEFHEVIEKMLAKAKKFDFSKVQASEISASGGGWQPSED
jgi:ParB family transcriptional regulator, chromosome partitioning protein